MVLYFTKTTRGREGGGGEGGASHSKLLHSTPLKRNPPGSVADGAKSTCRVMWSAAALARRASLTSRHPPLSRTSLSTYNPFKRGGRKSGAKEDPTPESNAAGPESEMPGGVRVSRTRVIHEFEAVGDAAASQARMWGALSAAAGFAIFGGLMNLSPAFADFVCEYANIARSVTKIQQVGSSGRGGGSSGGGGGGSGSGSNGSGVKVVYRDAKINPKEVEAIVEKKVRKDGPIWPQTSCGRALLLSAFGLKRHVGLTR